MSEILDERTNGSAGTPARLAIRDLDVTFATDAGEVHAVDGVSLEVAPGEILAVVGESGSGKSVTARSILGLLPETVEESGAVLVSGADVVGLSGARLRSLRGKDVSMVFQEPSSALNPVFPIWWQMGEGLRAHQPKLTRKQIRAKAIEALTAVGIPDPAERIDRYPARVLRRSEAAHHDRDGPRPRCRAHRGRRAHDRPRRHRAGRDPGPSARRPRPLRHLDHRHHPQHGRRRRPRRPRGRHAPRPRDRAGRRARAVRRAPARSTRARCSRPSLTWDGAAPGAP
jgi:hypothetical protein